MRKRQPGRNSRGDAATARGLMIRLNGIEATDVASTLFSTTVDLNAEFPALATPATRLDRHGPALHARTRRARLAPQMHPRIAALEHDEDGRRNPAARSICTTP